MQRDADVVGILDNRAATYCKLEKYDQARRDARNMIQKAKGDDRVSFHVRGATNSILTSL
jgi:F-box/TPR repeat protein Pof3